MNPYDIINAPTAPMAGLMAACKKPGRSAWQALPLLRRGHKSFKMHSSLVFLYNSRGVHTVCIHSAAALLLPNGALPTTHGTSRLCWGGAKDAFVAGVALARMKAEGGMPFGGSRNCEEGPGAVLGDAPRAAADALNVLTALLLALEDAEEVAIW